MTEQVSFDDLLRKLFNETLVNGACTLIVEEEYARLRQLEEKNIKLTRENERIKRLDENVKKELKKCEHEYVELYKNGDAIITAESLKKYLESLYE